MDPFDQDQTFKNVWAFWPRQENEMAARKALHVASQTTKIDGTRFTAACKIYVMKLEEPKFCKDLGNFIREDYWKDIYDEFEDVQAHLETLEKHRDNCIKWLKKWNELKCDWWSPVREDSIEDYVAYIDYAMMNDTFANHWREALDIIKTVLEKRPPDTDWRHPLIPNARWFCTVTPGKHTVQDILDYKWGHPDDGKVGPDFDPFAMESDRGETLSKEKAVNAFDEIFGGKEPEKKGDPFAEEETEESDTSSDDEFDPFAPAV